MSKNVWIAAAVVVVLVIAGWFLTRPKPAAAPEVSQPTPAPTTAQSISPSASPSANTSKNLVTISSSGFAPKAITIKVCGSVTWKNADSENHTVNSAPHPTHTAYPPLNLGLIKPGEEKFLAFPTAGTYKYHDHLNPSLTGSITVE